MLDTRIFKIKSEDRQKKNVKVNYKKNKLGIYSSRKTKVDLDEAARRSNGGLQKKKNLAMI